MHRHAAFRRSWAFIAWICAIVALLAASQSPAAPAAKKARKAQGQSAGSQPAKPKPNWENVQYGLYPQDVLDLWQAPSTAPTPLVIFIHGGGFTAGDKSVAKASALARCLEAGASFASINYRFRQDAAIQDILRDAGRAIQFLRFHAKDYNIDPKRIACYGGSAGAGMSLWLAAHDDLADPKSDDPVARESSRISAAGCLNVQASYDLRKWGDIMTGTEVRQFERSSSEAFQFYHFKDEAEMDTPEGRKIMDDCDMLGLITKDDPPIFVCTSLPEGEPQSRGEMVHSPRHAQAVKAKCDEVGVECQLVLPASDPNAPKDSAVAAMDFLLKHLGAAAGEKRAS
ncbi:MAG: alpha/beta hydrolase [Candidatus Sumerlaeota bacterium]|nr:alpha/beta hydrolase [Candidatus Sumerlaeota bacterium]